MAIDKEGMTNIRGLFAAGEAAGGMHGACRMAGNAATQAAVSGFAAAKGILNYQENDVQTPTVREYRIDKDVRAKNVPLIKDIVTLHINRERNADGLKTAINELKKLQDACAADTFSAQLAQSGLLLATAALERQESRGTHLRTDYPEQEESFYSILIEKNKDVSKIER